MVISEQPWETLCGLAKELTELTYSPDLDDEEMREGLRGVLELATDDEDRWDPPGVTKYERGMWRSGYQQAMADVMEAMADVWDVELIAEGTDGGGKP